MSELILELKCPYCRKSLMDEETQIDGHPSVKTLIQYQNKAGILRLSALFGSYEIKSDVYIPKDDLVLFFCPECRASLMLKDLCEECKAPLSFMELKNGGMVQICSRRGCKYHFVDYKNFAQKISAFYRTYQKFADPSKKK
ncbi:MAG: class I tRNA ligase family protein [Candidatus Aminicenantes bacterium]|nr:class I tRNA ligase family protein [Candidatus Aminicenantes bacterium]